MNIEWGLAGAVVMSGLVIVFLILTVLILCVMFTSRIVNGAVKVSGKTALKPDTSMPTEIPASPAPARYGDEDETMAVISAAVYSYMGDEARDTAYTIKSVTRAGGERPVWGFAGMQQNTRPF